MGGFVGAPSKPKAPAQPAQVAPPPALKVSNIEDEKKKDTSKEPVETGKNRRRRRNKQSTLASLDDSKTSLLG